LGTNVVATWLPRRLFGVWEAPGLPRVDRNSPKPEVRRDVPEMTDDMSPLRFVIQQLGVFAVPGYRIVVYGDEFKPRHCDFDSAAVLLEALGEAVPELDLSQLLLNPMQEGQGSIVFEGEMLLSEKQLSTLGLK